MEEKLRWTAGVASVCSVRLRRCVDRKEVNGGDNGPSKGIGRGVNNLNPNVASLSYARFEAEINHSFNHDCDCDYVFDNEIGVWWWAG